MAEWFNTQTDPEIAQAVARAEAEARKPVQQPGFAPPPELPPTPPAGGGQHAL